MSLKGILRHVGKRVMGKTGHLPQPGEKAPSFSTTDCNGRPISLQDLEGKWVVLWFFPKADTPG